jgi:glucosamine--fructose-6-phosphate aminotransferase (isomerizing)
MCGIVGYVGPRFAAPILLDGLKRLEYRGYDSAGIAVLNQGRIEIEKCEGKLENLFAALDGRTVPGFLGLGHTRWATHGEPSQTNAHPHPDCTGRLVVVHNGIIENYAALRQELLSRGHRFVSETDTEVVAHLIEEAYEGDLAEATRKALRGVRGAYAIGVFSVDEPELLVGARLFSPLVVGLGQGENYLASDIPALLPHTRRALILEDGEVVALDRQGVRVWTLEGEEVHREPFHISWDLEAAEKGGYPHFVLKEIHEQPEAIKNALRGRLDGERLGLSEVEGLDLSQIDRGYIVACGTSSYAALVGKRLIEEWARLPMEVAIASEFRYGFPVIDPRTLVILISQSGETADTLAALRLAKERGALTLALANIMGSSITRGADRVLYLQAGPEIGVVATKTYIAELVVVALLALELARRRGLLAESQIGEVVREVRALPRKMERVLESEEKIARLARRYADRRSFFFIGRGVDYPTALEGALKLKEISYIHAEGYPAGELKHGPIAMLDPEVPVVALATKGAQYPKIISNIQEVRARKAQVLALATEGDEDIEADEVIYVPDTLEPLKPILSIVPWQLFAYYVARERGCDIDKPRNLAKSVTVE